MSMEKIDSAEALSAAGPVGGQGKGFFTVGVVVDRIGVLNSKGGKTFSILKVSDLVKYNMARVKEHLGRQFKNDQESLKHALKAFNPDGYKTISIMAFNECAVPAKNIGSGTVVAVLNPRLMPPSKSSTAAGGDGKADQGLTFCIDTMDAIV